MMIFVFGLLHLVLAAPELLVNWASPEHNTIKITLRTQDELIEQCLKSGLEVRYRFEMRLCRKRNLWWDSCAPDQLLTRSLQFDPISEGYQLSFDTFRDKDAPEEIRSTSLADARSKVEQIAPLSIVQLSKGKEFKDNAKLYVSVRVKTECKGEYNRFFSRIPTVLTLGLVRIGGFDSGWVDFALSEPT